MEFTLVYQGPLKANGSPKEKQCIRRAFHRQLQILWQQRPLCNCPDLLQESLSEGQDSILRKVGPFTFAPLVNKTLDWIAELEVMFVRPEAPGALITQGGDIDNRLKTLFDALRMPKVESEIPNGDRPQDGENPLFCLLEDDNLITRVSVKSQQWLERKEDRNSVLLLIGVLTKTLDELSLGAATG